MSAFLKPVAKPKGFMMKMGYTYTRKQFGKVLSPLSVFSARMPAAFMSWYGKMGKLEKKLEIPFDIVLLIREYVASLNGCGYCIDANKWAALNKTANGNANAAKISALSSYTRSDRFTKAEKSLLDYITELTKNRKVSQATFDKLKPHYSERQICDIVWVVATEHLYNVTNIGLNIGSDGICTPISK